MSGVSAPEVLWAQRSSSEDEEKVSLVDSDIEFALLDIQCAKLARR